MAKTAVTPAFGMAIILTTCTKATFTGCTRGMWMNAPSTLTHSTPAIVLHHMHAVGTLPITFTAKLVGTKPFPTETTLTISSTVTSIIRTADTVMITAPLNFFKV